MTLACVRHLAVDAESAGQRLDNFLLRHLKGVPKTLVYRIIRRGEVRVNGARASAETRLCAGDDVRVPPVRLAERAPAAAPAVPARRFAVLYDDPWLLAIDKPAGVAVHGGSGVSFGVIEQLRRAYADAPVLELVHRLDRETSGILLVAKRRSALKAVQDQFRQRSTGKTYLALVRGAWPAARTVIDLPLHKYLLPNGERRVRVTDATDPLGQRAISLVRVLANIAPPPGAPADAPAMSLLAVTIKTGRTHQIRVHLAHSGHPIAGDDKYGDFGWNRALQRMGLKRMFLHAWRLSFQHPVLQQRVQLQAPLPDELTTWAHIPAFFDYNPPAD
jgi:23S rRNA pseudouridine955/2504/2580 synthase